MKMEAQTSKIHRTQQKQFKERSYSSRSLLQDTRKISNKQANCTPKGTRKTEPTKSTVSRTKKINHKDQREINETNTRKIEKINKTSKAASLKR